MTTCRSHQIASPRPRAADPQRGPVVGAVGSGLGALILIAALTACAKDTGFRAVDYDARATEVLDFGVAYVGDRVSRSLAVETLAQGSISVEAVSIDDADVVVAEPGPWTIAGHSEVTLELVWTPRAAGRLATAARLSLGPADLSPLYTTLHGEARALPSCNDDNPCTDDVFDRPSETCIHTDNAALCDDGSGCTEDDQCVAGRCLGRARTCVDDNPCTFDLCDPASGCVFSPGAIDCDDGDPCTVDRCDPDAGCTSSNADDWTPCGAFDCAVGHFCFFGGCQSVDVSGMSDGAPCNDQNDCSVDDVCQAGVCAPGPTRAIPELVASVPLYGGPGAPVATDGYRVLFGSFDVTHGAVLTTRTGDGDELTPRGALDLPFGRNAIPVSLGAGHFVVLSTYNAAENDNGYQPTTDVLPIDATDPDAPIISPPWTLPFIGLQEPYAPRLLRVVGTPSAVVLHTPIAYAGVPAGGLIALPVQDGSGAPVALRDSPFYKGHLGSAGHDVVWYENVRVSSDTGYNLNRTLHVVWARLDSDGRLAAIQSASLDDLDAAVGGGAPTGRWWTGTSVALSGSGLLVVGVHDGGSTRQYAFGLRWEGEPAVLPDCPAEDPSCVELTPGFGRNAIKQPGRYRVGCNTDGLCPAGTTCAQRGVCGPGALDCRWDLSQPTGASRGVAAWICAPSDEPQLVDAGVYDAEDYIQDVAADGEAIYVSQLGQDATSFTYLVSRIAADTFPAGAEELVATRPPRQEPYLQTRAAPGAIFRGPGFAVRGRGLAFDPTSERVLMAGNFAASAWSADLVPLASAAQRFDTQVTHIVLGPGGLVSGQPTPNSQLDCPNTEMSAGPWSQPTFVVTRDADLTRAPAQLCQPNTDESRLLSPLVYSHGAWWAVSGTSAPQSGQGLQSLGLTAWQGAPPSGPSSDIQWSDWPFVQPTYSPTNTELRPTADGRLLMLHRTRRYNTPETWLAVWDVSGIVPVTQELMLLGDPNDVAVVGELTLVSFADRLDLFDMSGGPHVIASLAHEANDWLLPAFDGVTAWVARRQENGWALVQWAIDRDNATFVERGTFVIRGPVLTAVAGAGRLFAATGDELLAIAPACE